MNGIPTRLAATIALILLPGCRDIQSVWLRTVRRRCRSRSSHGSCSRSVRRSCSSSSSRCCARHARLCRQSARAWPASGTVIAAGIAFPADRPDRTARLWRVADAGKHSGARTSATSRASRSSGSSGGGASPTPTPAGDRSRAPMKSASRSVARSSSRSNPPMSFTASGFQPRRQGRHDSGSHHAIAPARRSSGNFSRPMRRILRRRACADGDRGDRHAARGVRGVAGIGGQRRRRSRQPMPAGEARRCSSPPAAAPVTPFAARRRPERSDPTSRISARGARSASTRCR